ncbi:Biofilm and cell wall regulator 1 [Daldinia childiae]|uniref:Biofilm and cell wall regulator 1 n=1 Tax=Daldinia childiae TaxID=326645 RepID=UPI001444CCDB|nr:Biofilm and cell wall regulator 1 [Daldinia childiae]KAF3067222.1 Biofilm and cell wall regulator 1 [Daldinia childiae]
MAATFRPVNTPMAIEVKKDDGAARSPTTPTPTKASFGQRPLPTSPFPQAVQIPESIDERQTPKQTPKRENSQHSRKSRGGSEDVDMDEIDEETHGDDGAGSDDESVNADGTKSNKKKKSQRFYCTEYPPCNLSFTRSEHLARHIRKHTGERPFQCHCSRRFSRLDNLRQHAQTVHVNEDIPIDSLAATGTRFQRQIRTDRVRQPGRARASTAGSMGSPPRGHAKSLSTSSISSVGSNFSGRDDVRRRPPPLVMADPRSRLSIETYHNTESAYAYRPPSPSDFSTPTSATFSTGQNSPRWGSAIASPNSSHPRPQSMYAGHRTPGRRLSVPSGGIPFQSPHGAPLGRPLFGPGTMNTSNPGAFSPTGSLLGSPTSSIFSSRRESTSQTEDWRRRTWHPDSTNFSTVNSSSRLSNVVTPSQFNNPAPVPVAPQQSTTLRLPGIESFGPLPHRPVSPIRRNPSPMIVDSEVAHPPAMLPLTHSADPEERRSTVHWDMGLHRGLTRLDITSNAPSSDAAGTWAREANQAVEAEVDRMRVNPPTVRFNEPVVIESRPPGAANFARAYHQHTMSAPSIATSRESKRRGWYNGPVTVHADAPPEKIARVERMVHPNINEFTGFPARENTTNSQPRQENAGERDNMLRLQALVAVATSEGNATTAY